MPLPPLPVAQLAQDGGDEWPRGMQRGASAEEVPSPRPPAWTPYGGPEACAEGRLGGLVAAGENARCGMVYACGSGFPGAAFGRGGQALKAPLLWKNDQRFVPQYPGSARGAATRTAVALFRWCVMKCEIGWFVILVLSCHAVVVYGTCLLVSPIACFCHVSCVWQGEM